jgi:hypothetical protein
VRWALIEALDQAGTLTAAQASEMLGESPANCAFHLRTLAKYGFVEEAGRGRGRERPWRLAYDEMSWRTRQDDPQAPAAAEILDQVVLDRLLSRAQRSLTSMAFWPRALEDALGASMSRLYLTPEEAEELFAEIRQTFQRLFCLDDRFAERKDPKLRPADAVPVEVILLGYPVLDLPRCLPPGTTVRTARMTRAESGPRTVPPLRADARQDPGENVRPPRHNDQSERANTEPVGPAGTPQSTNIISVLAKTISESRDIS